MTMLRTQIWPAIAALLALTVMTGVIYPAAVTLVGQVAFNERANGSIIEVDGAAVGSAFIGQAFDDPAYFWSRPSAAGDGYDGLSSSGSNLASTSAALLERITADIERMQAAHGDGPIPVDLVTTSASGLDPHISIDAATYQAERVAAARGLDIDDVTAAIDRHTDHPVLGFLGEPVVNVLELNIDLDAMTDG